MSTHPMLPLYVDDFEAATAHLTPAEDGFYNRLLRLSWRTPGCSLPNDHRWISRKIRATPEEYEATVKPLLAEFFKLVRGRFVQRRLRDEYDYITRKISARVEAGSIGGRHKALNKKGKVPSKTSDLLVDTRALPEPAPAPAPYPDPLGGGVVRTLDATKDDDWPEGNHAALLVALIKSPWLDPNKSQGLVTTAGMVAGWRRNGASWEFDVIPVVTGLCAKRTQAISTWGYFKPALERTMADNRRELSMPQSVPAPQRSNGFPSLTEKIGAENAEARRIAFERMDAKNVAPS